MRDPRVWGKPIVDRFVAAPEHVLRPVVREARASSLVSSTRQTDYLAVAPRAFLARLEPLLEKRRADGLRIEAVAIEEVYDAFGHGESTPESLKAFLRHVYHHRRVPAVRYVLLVGDGSYDFKDYLGTGVENRIPPLMVKTSYLWTASDPGYAAINGGDELPDFAIGRLPAASVDEVGAMVHKILAWEDGGGRLDASAVFIADNSDVAGDFEANAEATAGKLSHSRRIFLGELGRDATRLEIQQAFDAGASLMSYLGHGGIHLWADENILNNADVSLLAPQSEQPLLLTMNCLNGYFHFPYFDSLSETLVKAEDRGAIAAFSPSGLSLNGPAHRLHELLLRELLEGDHARLGDAILAAQDAYATSGAFPELLQIFHLLGDPALRLR